jgi:hypothetical protein
VQVTTTREDASSTIETGYSNIVLGEGQQTLNTRERLIEVKVSHNHSYHNNRMAERRRHKVRSCRPTNLAYCIALLLCTGAHNRCCEAMKLNPVKPLPVKLDIQEEAVSVIASISDARVLVEVGDMPIREDIYSAIRILQATTSRWKSVESKLRSILTSDETKKVELLEVMRREITVVHAYLAKLYADVNEHDLAIREYESTCPTTFDESTLVTNLNPEEWLGCITNFVRTHIKSGNLLAVHEFQASLLSRMPWFSAFVDHSSVQPRLTVERFSFLSKTGRRRLAGELAMAWFVAERMRTELKEASQEFTMSEGYEKQKLISLSSDKYIESVLKEYPGLDAEVIFRKTVEGQTIVSITNDELELREKASTSLTSQEENEIIAKVREICYDQLEKEGNYYLTIMKGLLDKGRSYVQCKIPTFMLSPFFVISLILYLTILAALFKAKEQEYDQRAPIGFQSFADVLSIFQQLQAEAKLAKKTRTAERKVGNQKETTQKHHEKPTSPKPSSFLGYCSWFRIMGSLLAILFVLSVYEPNSPIPKSRVKPILKVAKKNQDEEVQEKKDTSFLSASTSRFTCRIQKAVWNICNNSYIIFILLKSFCVSVFSTILPLVANAVGNRGNQISEPHEILSDELLLTAARPKVPIQKKASILNSVKTKPSPNLKAVSGPVKIKTSKMSSSSLATTSDGEQDETISGNVTAPIETCYHEETATKVSSTLAFNAEANVGDPLDDESNFELGEWTECKASNTRKPKSPKTKSCVALSTTTSRKPDNSSAPNRKALNASPKAGMLKVPKPKSLTVKSSIPESTSPSRLYDHAKLEVDDVSDGSGSTSEESYEHVDANQMTSTQDQHPTVSNSQTLTAKVSPVDLTPTSSIDLSAIPVQWLPGPDGHPAPYLIGPDGLFYPYNPSLYPVQTDMPYFPPIPPMVVNEEARAVAIQRIANQISYYFCKENIVKDAYLQKLMDDEKFVCLKEIMQFKRIVYFSGGDNVLVLEAIRYLQTSSTVEIITFVDHTADLSPDEIISHTKLRSLQAL